VSIEKLKKEKEVTIKWRHYPLHPEIPKEGLSIRNRKNDQDKESRRAYAQFMEDQMLTEGLPYRRRSDINNSRMAQELAAWADSQVEDDGFHHNLFKAYFADNKNIGDKETLLEIVAETGLDTELARKSLETRSYSDEVNRDWEFARENGITGVPTFFAKDLFLYGSQPYEVLERFYNNLAKNDSA